MSRIETTTRQTLTLAGMVLTATLVLPAVSQAQSITEEQMLLNRIAPTVGQYQGLAVPLAEATSAESSNRIDGKTAMGGNKAGASIQPPAGPQPTAAGHTRLPRALELPLSYGGVGAEGVDLLWRGTTVGPLSGQATVRMAYAGSPENRGRQVWPVTALLFFSADDYRSSFIAELSGTMEWTKGEMLLTGVVTDGPSSGTQVQQLLRLRDSTLNGSLMLRFQSRNTESVAAETAKDGNDAVGRRETWISGEQALLGRISPVESRGEGGE
jgi:hypothetical protein